MVLEENCIIAETMSRYSHPGSYFTREKKSPFSVLTRYKLLAHSQLGKVRETNYVWVHKAALRELILPSCHAGCSEKQMLFRLNWKI